MSKIDVWIINQFAILPSQTGGTRHYSLTKYFDKEVFSIKIIAGRSSYGSTTLQTNHGRVVIDNVEFIFLKDSLRSDKRGGRLESTIFFITSMIMYFIQFNPKRTKPIIVGSSPNLLTAFASYLTSKVFNLKYILEVRDIWPQSIVELTTISNSNLIIRIMAWMERYLYDHSHHIVALLEGFREHRDAITNTRTSITWIPNGFDLSLIENVENDNKRINESDFTLFYAGAHGIPNNLSDLIEAADIISRLGHNNIKICLIGDGIRKDQLRREVITKGLMNVEFANPVAKKDLYKILAKADAFVLPGLPSSLYQFGVSPNKLFDYFAMRKPIIFAIGTPYDPVKTSKSGISVSPGDPKLLAEAIIQLSRINQKEREVMGNNGYDYLISNHDIKKLSEKYQSIFLSLNKG